MTFKPRALLSFSALLLSSGAFAAPAACELPGALAENQMNFIHGVQNGLADPEVTEAQLANPEDVNSCVFREQKMRAGSRSDSSQVTSSAMLKLLKFEVERTSGISTNMEEFKAFDQDRVKPENEKTNRLSVLYARTKAAYQSTLDALDNPKTQALLDKKRDEFRKEQSCFYGIDAKLVKRSSLTAFTVAENADARKLDATPQADKEKIKVEADTWIAKWANQANVFCGGLYLGAPAQAIRRYSEVEPVTLKAKVMMKDNQDELTAAQSQAVIAQIQNDSQIKKNIACGRSITGIKIQSSSNKLRNTAPAGQKSAYGQWGFADLSSARARSLNETVIKKLNLPGVAEVVAADQVNVELLGEIEKGKPIGSSGPCPYRFKKRADNRFDVVLDPAKMADKAVTSQLDQSRFIQVVINFDQGKPVKGVAGCQYDEELKNQPYDLSYKASCFEVKMSCKAF